MRHRYLVAYDVHNEKRLRRVLKCMKGYGEPAQYSVFFCDLSDREKVLMIADLTSHIKHDEDQVMIVNLGPAEGRARDAVEYLGKQEPTIERGAVIL